jgi:enamine deaminase RidA (YjgF/YER057c/UK114 family)
MSTIPLGVRVNEVIYGHLDPADSVTRGLAATDSGQADRVVSKLGELLDRSGVTPNAIEEIAAVCRSDASYRLLSERLATTFAAGPGAPRLRESIGSLPEGHSMELQCVLRATEAQARPTSIAPIELGGPNAVRAHGYAIGPLVVSPRIGPRSSSDGSVQGDDGLDQLRYTLRNVADSLSAAGSSWREVARATVFMNPIDLPSLNLAWAEIFPDPERRPPHKYVPAPLPKGELVAVQVLAVRGVSPLQVIELDSIHHGDWMTMAARTGNVVTSSRIIAPRSDDAGAYTEQVLDNIEEIMGRAAGSLRDLQQITSFIGDASYRGLVEDDLRRRLGEQARLPVMHFIQAPLGGVRAPRMEILGLIGE